MNFMNKKLQFYIWVFLFLCYYRNQFYNVHTSAINSILLIHKIQIKKIEITYTCSYNRKKQGSTYFLLPIQIRI